MSVRDKLIAIIMMKPYNMSRLSAELLADHLLSHGVTVQVKKVRL